MTKAIGLLGSYMGGDKGTLFDLDLKVKKGVVSKSGGSEALVLGDIHIGDYAAKMDGHVSSLVKKLNPRNIFLHDLISFRARSHHTLKNPHFSYYYAQIDQASIEKELREASEFLKRLRKLSSAKLVVVPSNHHRHIQKYLTEYPGLTDAPNAEFWLRMNLRCLEEIKKGVVPSKINFLKEALTLVDNKLAQAEIKFLEEDEEYTVCNNCKAPIICSLHGDLGPNGSRGSPSAFVRMGKKVVVGHSHSASIKEGCYVVGMLGDLSPSYAKGPSTWSHSSCVVYPNGTRAILTANPNDNLNWKV